MSKAFAHLRATKYRDVQIGDIWWRLRRANANHLKDLTAMRIALVRPLSDLVTGTVDQGVLEIEDDGEREAALQKVAVKRFVDELLTSDHAVERLNDHNHRVGVIAQACVIACRHVDEEGWDDCTLVADESAEDADLGQIWWMTLDDVTRSALGAAALDHTMGQGVRQQAESFPGGPRTDGTG